MRMDNFLGVIILEPLKFLDIISDGYPILLFRIPI